LVRARDRTFCKLLDFASVALDNVDGNPLLWKSVEVLYNTHAAICQQLKATAAPALDEGERKEIRQMAEAIHRQIQGTGCEKEILIAIASNLDHIAERRGA
jgi:hypothetical protein